MSYLASGTNKSKIPGPQGVFSYQKHNHKLKHNPLAVLIVLGLMVCLYLLPLIHDQKPWDVAEQKMERREHRLKKK